MCIIGPYRLMVAWIRATLSAQECTGTVIPESSGITEYLLPNRLLGSLIDLNWLPKLTKTLQAFMH